MAHEAALAAAIAERMRPLRRHYFESLRQRMPVIERALVMLVSQEFNQPPDILALQTEAHKLAGTGATYGFPKISETAKALEEALLAQDANHEQWLTLVAELLSVCHEAMAEPLQEPAQAAEPEAPAPHAHDTCEQPHILVADDDEAVRDLLKRKLSHAGCKVVCAEDGAQAWHLLQTQRFALTVLDLMMPGYDGMTLLRMMQSHAETARIPVVFLTARDLSDDVLDGLNTGAADYITKPFNSDELVSRCIRLLRPSGRRSERMMATRRRDESTADC